MGEAITYRQLKEFVNKIDEQFLDNTVLVFQEEGSLKVTAEICKEEMMVYDDGEYPNTISTRDEYKEFCSCIDPDEHPEIKKIIPPGLPMIWEDFKPGSSIINHQSNDTSKKDSNILRHRFRKPCRNERVQGKFGQCGRRIGSQHTPNLHRRPARKLPATGRKK